MSIPGAASPLFLGAAVAEAAAYQIDRSVRLNSADSAHFSRTPSSAGNRKTWTWSGWVKRSGLGVAQAIFGEWNASAADGLTVYLNSANQLFIQDYNASFVEDIRLITTQVFRDVGAWFSLVIAVDTTQSTSSDRVKIYINGSQVTAFSSSTYPGLNFDTRFNRSQVTGLGRSGALSSSYYFNGYLADVHFIDGQALAPSDFGEYDSDNNWNPKAFAGSYGTNGFHLDFSDASSTTTLAEDSSGNNNDWTANNLSVASGAGNDSLIDTPTNYEADSGNNGGNYATLNPLDAGTSGMLSDGNLTYNLASGSNYTVRATQGMSSGKWYAEWTFNSGGNSDIGIASHKASLTLYLGEDQYGYIYYNQDGGKYNNASGASYGAAYGHGDIIGIAFDADAGSLTFYKNGTSQGTAFTGLSDFPYFFAVGSNNTNGTFNFGQRPFAYTPPTGFLPLVTTSLTDPTIADGSTAMDAVAYAGNGGTQSITGLAFSPSLVWYKSRNNVGNNALFDVVRGATKRLVSNDTAAEDTRSGVTSFDSGGWTEGSFDNQSGYTYVAWAWDGGTTTATNTDGSITSNVRANQSAGFSIVTYTGNGTAASVGSGLNVPADFIILKNRFNTTYGNWKVYHKDFTATYNGELNTTAAPRAYGGGYVYSSTSGLIQFATSQNYNEVNISGNSYVAYCFAPVAGYSAFGSYTGNGSSDGPFVYTGFRPAVIIFKNTDSANNWAIFDSARDSYNVVDNYLLPNTSGAEATASSIQVDFLSNGFKLRGSWQGMNESASTIVYAAWAESPFKYARAR